MVRSKTGLMLLVCGLLTSTPLHSGGTLSKQQSTNDTSITIQTHQNEEDEAEREEAALEAFIVSFAIMCCLSE